MNRAPLSIQTQVSKDLCLPPQTPNTVPDRDSKRGHKWVLPFKDLFENLMILTEGKINSYADSQIFAAALAAGET